MLYWLLTASLFCFLNKMIFSLKWFACTLHGLGYHVVETLCGECKSIWGTYPSRLSSCLIASYYLLLSGRVGFLIFSNAVMMWCNYHLILHKPQNNRFASANVYLVYLREVNINVLSVD